jgi:hypothetical protein
LQKIIAGEDISISSIVQDFSGINLTERKNFISLFYYLGLLTIKESKLDVVMHIPNETVKRIDIDFIKEALAENMVFNANNNTLTDTLKDFALNGNIEVFRAMAHEIKRNTSIRDYITGEVIVKAMYITYLSLTNYYVIKSEAEMNKGFADLYLAPLNPYVEYFGIVEIKFIKRSDAISSKIIEQKYTEAIEQLNKYEQDEIVQNTISLNKKLVKVALIFHGWELVKSGEVV